MFQTIRYFRQEDFLDDKILPISYCSLHKDEVRDLSTLHLLNLFKLILVYKDLAGPLGTGPAPGRTTGPGICIQIRNQTISSSTVVSRGGVNPGAMRPKSKFEAIQTWEQSLILNKKKNGIEECRCFLLIRRIRKDIAFSDHRDSGNCRTINSARGARGAMAPCCFTAVEKCSRKMASLVQIEAYYRVLVFTSASHQLHLQFLWCLSVGVCVCVCVCVCVRLCRICH